MPYVWNAFRGRFGINEKGALGVVIYYLKILKPKKRKKERAKKKKRI